MMVIFSQITPLVVFGLVSREVVLIPTIAIPTETYTFSICRILLSEKYEDWLSDIRFYSNSDFWRFRNISNHRVCPGPSITTDLFCWSNFRVHYLYLSCVTIELSIDLCTEFFEIILNTFEVFLVLFWNKINIGPSIFQGTFTHFCIFLKKFFQCLQIRRRQCF